MKCSQILKCSNQVYEAKKQDKSTIQTLKKKFDNSPNEEVILEYKKHLDDKNAPRKKKNKGRGRTRNFNAGSLIKYMNNQAAYRIVADELKTELQALRPMKS